MRCGVAWLVLTALLGVAMPCRAADVLLAADADLRAPLARALGDAGLTPAPEAPPEAPGRASEILDEAARAYATMEPGRTLTLLAEARAELDRVGGGEDGPGLAVRLGLLEALALRAAAREPEVDEALRRALAAAPDLAIDPVEYPPWLRERAVALAAAAGPIATLELAGAPGAEARIDGTVACVLPCSRALPAGAHRVRVVRDGRRPFVAALDVTGRTTLDVALEPDVAALAEEARAAISEGRSPDAALTAFASVVWVTVRRSAAGARVLEGALFGAEAPRRSASVPVPTDDPASVERACHALISALTAPPVLRQTRVDRRRRTPRPGPGPTRWFERPWVWIAAGAVVLAGGIGIAVAAAPEPEGWTPELEVPR